jgi:hypothetical protein
MPPPQFERKFHGASLVAGFSEREKIAGSPTKLRRVSASKVTHKS